MANVKLNPVFESMSKKVGDLVFFRKNGATYVRRKGENRDPRSESQLSVRSAFSELVEIWHALGEAARSNWDNYANGQAFTGYNAFIGRNAVKQRQGRALDMAPAAEELAGFTAGPGKKGELSCTVPAVAEGVSVALFTQKVDKEAGNGPVEHHDAKGGESSVITGLDSGATYHVYALAAQGAGDEARRVIAVSVLTVEVK